MRSARPCPEAPEDDPVIATDMDLELRFPADTDTPEPCGTHTHGPELLMGFAGGPATALSLVSLAFALAGNRMRVK